MANIVRDLSIRGAGEGDKKHKVIEAVETLESILKIEPLNKDKLKEICSVIEAECDIDLARRCLASTKNAYNWLYDALQKVQTDNDALLSVLKALCALCNGQPDVLDMRGTLFLPELLSKPELSKECVATLVKLINYLCIMHEHNRQGFVDKGIIKALMKTFETYSDDKSIVMAVCSALRSLTLDDDVRVPFGKAHEHAKMIVTEANALKVILKISKGK